MKKLYYLDEQEKQRILNLHTESTKRQYLPQKQVLKEWSYIDDAAAWLLKKGTVKNVNTKFTPIFKDFFSKDKKFMWYSTQFTDNVKDIFGTFKRNLGSRFKQVGDSIVVDLPIASPKYGTDTEVTTIENVLNDKGILVPMDKNTTVADAIDIYITRDFENNRYLANQDLRLKNYDFKTGEEIPSNYLYDELDNPNITSFFESTIKDINDGVSPEDYLKDFITKGAKLTRSEQNEITKFYKKLQDLNANDISYVRNPKSKFKVGLNYTVLGVGTLALTGGLEYLFSSLMGRDKKDVGIATMKARCASKGACDAEFKKKYEQVIIAIKKATESTIGKMPFLYQINILPIGEALNNSIENWNDFCNLNACFKQPANDVDPASGVGYSLIDLLNNEIFDNTEYNPVGCAITRWKANAGEFDNIINNSAETIWKRIERDFYDTKSQKSEKGKAIMGEFGPNIKDRWTSQSLGNKILNTWALAQGLSMGEKNKDKYNYKFVLDPNTDKIIMALHGIDGAVALRSDDLFYLASDTNQTVFDTPIRNIKDIFDIYWLLHREECMAVVGMTNPF
jgi:hypothetical protein